MSKPQTAEGVTRWRECKNSRQRLSARPLTVDPPARAQLYSHAFPNRPPLASTAEWLTGTWAVGACWKNPNPLYGSYPRTYLERVHAMFPEARTVLHVFSGGLTLQAAREHCPQTDVAVALVDVKGPEDGRHPTWRGDVVEYCMQYEGLAKFDLILADPPYSPEDAEVYGTPMPNRGEVIRELRRVARPGGVLAWLDQVWPMHRKDQWRCWGQIGLVRSTNHRVRLVSLFEAV